MGLCGLSTAGSNIGLDAKIIGKPLSEWEKFSHYILGKKFHLDTDHKPLVPLLSMKYLDHLPPRVLRFRLRLTRFQYTIVHVPGQWLNTADTLSRAPFPDTTTTSNLESEAKFFISSVASQLPASSDHLQAYRAAQSRDTTCSLLNNYCKNGWLKRHVIEGNLVPYLSAKSELTVYDDLLLYRDRIVIPKPMRQETLHQAHWVF